MKVFECKVCGKIIPEDALWKDRIKKHINTEHKDLKKGKPFIPFEVVKTYYEHKKQSSKK